MGDAIEADDLATCRECLEVIAAGSARRRINHGLEEHGTSFIDFGPPEDADRLFVPLNTEPFRWYEAGEKDVELRGVNANFNFDTVQPGRRAELRHGYSGDSLWGEIGEVWSVPAIGLVPHHVDHWRIVPEVDTPTFIDRAHDLLGDYDHYVAFEVDLDD